MRYLKLTDYSKTSRTYKGRYQKQMRILPHFESSIPFINNFDYRKKKRTKHRRILQVAILVLQRSEKEPLTCYIQHGYISIVPNEAGERLGKTGRTNVEHNRILVMRF